MKKILDVDQTRTADAHTIKNEPITSIDLMERAANAFASALEKKLDLKKYTILIVCGIGNNGGDGLAVARILTAKGIQNTSLLIQFKQTLSPDCQINLNRLKNVQIARSENELPDFSAFDLIIDGLFGSGINAPVKGLPGEVIKRINSANKLVYAIDLPSGLYSDSLNDSSTIIQADEVISFQRPKLSFFFPENSKYIRNWKFVDIGLDEEFIQSQNSKYFLLDDEVRKMLQKRERYSHKGTYGHALIFAGSYGKMGAAVLSARACMRSGVGLCSSAIPKCGYEIMQSAIPEVMCQTDEHPSHLTSLPALEAYSAIGIGPGLGQEKESLALLEKLLASWDKPLIIDADALNLIATNPHLLKAIPKESILTPHIKEFDRLAGPSTNSIERFNKQLSFSKKYDCIVVLKDAHTSVSNPKGQLFFNTTGNPGMATGGSGDVLTGLITSLSAQGYNSLDAAILGVYFHGVAGDSAAQEYGQSAMIASDIIEALRLYN